jgi:hypothetical protein
MQGIGSLFLGVISGWGFFREAGVWGESDFFWGCRRGFCSLIFGLIGDCYYKSLCVRIFVRFF